MKEQETDWKNLCDAVADLVGLDILQPYTKENLIRRIKAIINQRDRAQKKVAEHYKEQAAGRV